MIIVEMKHKDNQNNDWDAGEIGILNGYIKTTTGPCACVIIGERIVMTPLHSLRVIEVR